VRGAWTRTLTPRSELHVQAAADYSFRDVPLQFQERRDSGEIEAQHRFLSGRHDLMSGASVEITRDSTTSSSVLFFEPAARTLALVSVFVQDEIALAPGKLWVTPGLRLLKNTFTGIESHPALRARWKPVESQTLWAAASRAVRLPSRFDRDLRFTGASQMILVAGGDDFRAETVVALEAGYRAQVTRRLAFDISAFANRYDALRSQAPGGAAALSVISNDLNGRSRGVEAGVNAQASRWLRLHASYTRLATSTTVDAGRVDLGGGISEFNDPRHQLGLRAYASLARGFEADAFARYVSELPHPAVPAYGELDLRLGWVSAHGHEVSILGRNLLHDHHPEFSPAGPRRYEFERAIALRTTWRF
jgi:iron complex outermembrane receptor protein